MGQAAPTRPRRTVRGSADRLVPRLHRQRLGPSEKGGELTDPNPTDRAQAVVNAGTGVGVILAALLVMLAPGGWRASWAGFAIAVVLVAWATDRTTT